MSHQNDNIIPNGKTQYDQSVLAEAIKRSSFSVTTLRLCAWANMASSNMNASGFLARNWLHRKCIRTCKAVLKKVAGISLV